MHPPLTISSIRRSITAIACTAAIVISAGCGDSSSPKLGNSSPNQTPQTASVEPTPEETAADQRARALLAQMPLDEKVDVMHGESNNFYGFYNAPIPRLVIPALTMVDGPMGVRIARPDVNGQRATQLPSGLALAATWDTSLAELYGKLMGEEAHSTGHNIMLGPVFDIARIAQFGRVFENYGEDPLLSGMAGAANIFGIQTIPVTTSVKHYNFNFQETNRLFGNNSIVDKRTLQEIHTRPYAIAVRDARPGSIIGAFKVNGAFSCESELILNEILKTRLDFQGWVLTDYFASFSTVPAALAGIDQEMSGSTGEVAGSEIVQVYAGKLPPPLPTAPKSLAGFAKVALQPGQSQDVTIALTPESLSYWDVTMYAWVAPAGNVPILVGASSADIRVNGTVQTAATTPAAPAPAATAAPPTSAPLATTGRAALEVP